MWANDEWDGYWKTGLKDRSELLVNGTEINWNMEIFKVQGDAFWKVV